MIEYKFGILQGMEEDLAVEERDLQVSLPGK